MLDRDDGDDFVAELIDELLENVDKLIYTNNIESQLIPYTVSQAKDAILQIIEVFYSCILTIFVVNLKFIACSLLSNILECVVLATVSISLIS